MRGAGSGRARQIGPDAPQIDPRARRIGLAAPRIDPNGPGTFIPVRRLNRCALAARRRFAVAAKEKCEDAEYRDGCIAPLRKTAKR
jgi:hypothetical protein